MDGSCSQSYCEKKFHDELKIIVRGAGDVLLKYFRKPLEKHYKSDQEFATQADLESEKYLISKLKKLLPESSICAEESGVDGDGEFQWVIDPLDGTTNFASGVPFFCVSVALTKKNKPVVGAIYAPIFNEFFFNTRGKKEGIIFFVRLLITLHKSGRFKAFSILVLQSESFSRDLNIE